MLTTSFDDMNKFGRQKMAEFYEYVFNSDPGANYDTSLRKKLADGFTNLFGTQEMKRLYQTDNSDSTRAAIAQQNKMKQYYSQTIGAMQVKTKELLQTRITSGQTALTSLKTTENAVAKSH